MTKHEILGQEIAGNILDNDEKRNVTIQKGPNGYNATRNIGEMNLHRMTENEIGQHRMTQNEMKE